MKHEVQPTPSRSGEAEAFILIKATPHVSQKHGETVCCAAVDIYKKWLRLYPVSFRHLNAAKRFGRWDRVKFKWRLPKDDSRVESRRVDQETLEVVGEMPRSRRAPFLASLCVDSLRAEREQGRSLALLRPEILSFEFKRKSGSDAAREADRFQAMRSQGDLLNAAPIIPYNPCPFRFLYRYRDADGEHEGTCQDWETETTFFRWSRAYGEQEALQRMQKVFGEEYPRQGMVLAMGTHSRRPDQWLVNGVVRLDEVNQQDLF